MSGRWVPIRDRDWRRTTSQRRSAKIVSSLDGKMFRDVTSKAVTGALAVTGLTRRSPLASAQLDDPLESLAIEAARTIARVPPTERAAVARRIRELVKGLGETAQAAAD